MRSVTFELDDAYFGDGQNGSSDLRLRVGSGAGRVRVDWVRVIKR